MSHGGVRENSGPKKGVKYQKTQDWEKFGKKLLSEKNLSRAEKIIDNCDDETFMKYLEMLLEYFQPKLSRTDLNVKQETEVIIKMDFGKQTEG